MVIYGSSKSKEFDIRDYDNFSVTQVKKKVIIKFNWIPFLLQTQTLPNMKLHLLLFAYNKRLVETTQ